MIRSWLILLSLSLTIPVSAETAAQHDRPANFGTQWGRSHRSWLGIVPDTLLGQPPEEIQASGKPHSHHQVLTTPEGVRFGLLGDKDEAPAPVAFLFGSLFDESLAGEHCRILRKLGFVCVALDAPGHGSDRNSAEPLELRAWRHRLDSGNDFVTVFNRKVSGVLDYLVAQHNADPERVVAVGGSRGGFLAYHFAASDKRVKSVAGLAPVTELRALVEFEGMGDHELTQSLALIRHAPRLAGRHVLVIIGDQDERVGTDHAVAFARSVSREADDARVDLHVLSEPRGHYHPVETGWLLAQWSGKFLEGSKR